MLKIYKYILTERKVFDGYTILEKLEGKINVVRQHSSTGNTMTIRFQTNGGYGARKFRIYFNEFEGNDLHLGSGSDVENFK